jgi:transposase-like protein
MSKRFSEQFKQEAVQLVSAERPISEVASQLGVGYSTLDKWVRAHRKSTGQLVSMCCSVRTVCRRMQRLGLRARYAKKFKRTTHSNHAHAVAPNHLSREFAVSEPNRVWVGDIDLPPFAVPI